LIRRLLALSGAGPATQIDGKPLYDLLLEPHAYLREVGAAAAAAVGAGAQHRAHHGGGPTGNIPRVMRQGSRP